MRNYLRIRIGCALVTALLVAGCGDDSKGSGTGNTDPSSSGGMGNAGDPGASGNPGGCSAPVLDGSPFGANGTATVTGQGTLPDGIADGLEVQVEVVQGPVSIGVLPENLFAENDRVCGKTFRYTIRKLEAGTYRMAFVVFDPNSDSTMPKYEGQGPSDFTVTDGQMLTLDTVFALK
jgi:hypothetical protein